MREVMARFPESFFVVIARDTAAEYLAEVERLEVGVRRLQRLEASLNAVVAQPDGLAGYHLNGAIATWGELDLWNVAEVEKGVNNE